MELEMPENPLCTDCDRIAEKGLVAYLDVIGSTVGLIGCDRHLNTALLKALVFREWNSVDDDPAKNPWYRYGVYVQCDDAAGDLQAAAMNLYRAMADVVDNDVLNGGSVGEAFRAVRELLRGGGHD